MFNKHHHRLEFRGDLQHDTRVLDELCDWCFVASVCNSVSSIQKHTLKYTPLVRDSYRERWGRLRRDPRTCR